MRTCAQYIAEAKRVLDDPTMSDRALGAHLGYAQQTIAQAKKGKMSDGVALALGELLARHGIVDEPGEVLLVAHAERDADPRVRNALMAYAGKVIASAAKIVSASALVLLGLSSQPLPAEASGVGGAGRLRKR